MAVITNWGDAVVSALGNALDLVLTFIPKLLGFLVICSSAGLSRQSSAKRWSSAAQDRFLPFGRSNWLDPHGAAHGCAYGCAGILGKIVYCFLFLIFLIPAVNALGLTSVSGILNTLIAYIPNVFVVILVLFLATLAATFVADIVRGATSSAHICSPTVFANIARFAIIGFAALIALEQLQIAPVLLNSCSVLL